MRFDYLHSARPVLLQRLVEIRVPERLHNALFALAGSAALIAGACGIDAYRLRQALNVQAVYQLHYDRSAARLQQTHLYYERVKTLVALDSRVRGIAVSGDADARTLAEIANRLPTHAWLTGISHDGTGLALDGSAKDLGVISAVMHGLMNAKHLRSPKLVSAALDNVHGHGGAMKYEIHIDGAAP